VLPATTPSGFWLFGKRYFILEVRLLKVMAVVCVCVCVRSPTSARGGSSYSERRMRGGVSEMKFFTMRMQRKWGGGDNLSFSMYEVVRVQNGGSSPNQEH